MAMVANPRGAATTGSPAGAPALAHAWRPPAPPEHLIVKLALALGAESRGGPLSAGEEDYLAQARSVPDPPAALVDQMRASILAGDDPLGELLCQMRPASVRRQQGAFYTPPTLVGAMLEWLLAQQPDSVVDPGCGSGRFAVTAARLQPSLPVVALDSDPVATIMTRAGLAVVGARAACVRQGDYLTDDLPPGAGRRGFIANPPYVRHHDLAPEVKAWSAMAGLRLGIPVSGLAGLHALFYLATALQARSGDVGCFITSAEWLDTRYGEAIRRLLLEHLGLQLLAVIDPQSMPFANVMTTAAISCFRVGKATNEIAVKSIRRLDDLRLEDQTDVIERRCLREAGRWSRLLREAKAGSPAASAAAFGRATVPLGTVARVHRGTATGANEFFVLTREQAATRGLLPWCRPVITRARELFASDGVIHDGPERRLLLVVPADVDREAHPALDAYLREGERSIGGRYLLRHRRPWWYLGPLVAPPIVASYMARQAPVFARNPGGLLLLNIAHGIYPRRPLAEAALSRLVEQLNRTRQAFRGRGRTYQGGLEKFEPREMELLPVSLEGVMDAAIHPA